MKILMLDPIPLKGYRISKDTSGGYGTGNDFGDSLIPNVLKKILAKNSDWPTICSIQFSVIKKHNINIDYSQKFIEEFDKYNLIIIVSSIVSHETEIKFIKKIKAIDKKIPIVSIGPLQPIITNFITIIIVR